MRECALLTDETCLDCSSLHQIGTQLEVDQNGPHWLRGLGPGEAVDGSLIYSFRRL